MENIIETNNDNKEKIDFIFIYLNAIINTIYFENYSYKRF